MRSEDLLDELDASIGIGRRTGKLAIPGLSAEDIQSLKEQGNPVAALAEQTTTKGYRTLHRHRNTLSHSIRQGLNSCARRMILEKLNANRKHLLADALGEEDEGPANIDFVFGHSVGAGIQAYLAFNKNLQYALYAAYVSWYGSWELGREDYSSRKKKNIERAVIAVEMFAAWWSANMEDEWELVFLSDGRPAIELSFCVDFGKSKYFGHIDLVLRNKRTGKIAIGENKTTGFSNPHEAAYKNSGQALGYSVVLDALFPGVTDYDVLYYAYSAPGEQWHFFPFAKTVAMKLEWIQDVLIDSGHMQQYFQLQHFPKNGGSCLQFNRPCQFFGACDLIDKEQVAALPSLEDSGEKDYPVDYYLTLESIMQQQVVAHVDGNTPVVHQSNTNVGNLGDTL